MNLSHLRYFVELAHTRHYTRAAEHLFTTQPSLSPAIGQLESELGVPLFERSGRNTTLTRLGEEFLVCAERTLSTLDSGVESLRRSAQGEGLIRLGLVRPLGVDFIPDLAARFLAGKRSTSPSAPGSLSSCWTAFWRGATTWSFPLCLRRSWG